MEIFKSVTKKSLIVLIPVLIAALFIESRKMPLGIFFGWLFGVINFKGMTKNIEAMTDVHKAKLKIFILSITRLAFLFAAIFAMAYYKLVNIIGLLIGFTIVFIFILVEGMKRSGSNL
jgi:ABC-type multidrug transport system permease subunit